MLRALIFVGSLSLLVAACGGGTEQAAPPSATPEPAATAQAEGGWTQPSPDGKPSLSAEDANAVGRYIAVVALCNDCHTAGWLPRGDVPEEMWMAGNPVGYEGPWGITFPSNLRLRAQEWTEDQWVETLRTRKALDPMPWIAVNQMSEKDSRAFYRYLRNLGPIGQHMPAPIPPGAPRSQPYTTLRVWPAGTEDLPWQKDLMSQPPAQ
jgi:mono/diheme cytochrome c family protein